MADTLIGCRNFALQTSHSSIVGSWCQAFQNCTKTLSYFVQNTGAKLFAIAKSQLHSYWAANMLKFSKRGTKSPRPTLLVGTACMLELFGFLSAISKKIRKCIADSFEAAFLKDLKKKKLGVIATLLSFIISAKIQ